MPRADARRQGVLPEAREAVISMGIVRRKKKGRRRRSARQAGRRPAVELDDEYGRSIPSGRARARRPTGREVPPHHRGARRPRPRRAARSTTTSYVWSRTASSRSRRPRDRAARTSSRWCAASVRPRPTSPPTTPFSCSARWARSCSSPAHRRDGCRRGPLQGLRSQGRLGARRADLDRPSGRDRRLQQRPRRRHRGVFRSPPPVSASTCRPPPTSCSPSCRGPRPSRRRRSTACTASARRSP